VKRIYSPVANGDFFLHLMSELFKV